MASSLDPDPRATLIVEDDAATRELLVELLSLDQIPAVGADSVAAARTLLGARAFACAVIDKDLPDGSGLEVLRLLREESPEAEAVMLTGAANVSSAVEALRLGASDYLLKPVDPTLFRRRLAFLLERRAARAENLRLQARLLQSERAGSIGVLAAALAHELNSPLAYVTANLNFLRDRLEELAPQVGGALEELLSAIDESRQGTAQMRATVEQVQLLEQGHREALGPVDVQDALTLAIELAMPLAPRASAIRRQLQPVPKVIGTRARLLQAFLEVLNLALGADRDRAAEVLVVLESEERFVKVSVTASPAPAEFAAFGDTGSLLSVPHRARVLGASVSRGIVHSLGGECVLDPSGATLQIRLPVAPGSISRDVLDPSSPVGLPR